MTSTPAPISLSGVPTSGGPASLLTLRDDPTELGRRASEARRAAFEDAIEIVATDAAADTTGVASATVVRDGQARTVSRWPTAAELEAGDHVLLRVDADHAGAHAWAQWLFETGVHLPALIIAPFTHEPAGLFRLWTLAAARMTVPPTVRVAARHDLIGIRLAQLALGFGADTLAGPIEPDRVLPLAGVTRPDENTLAGLTALVEALGLRAVTSSSTNRPAVDPSP
jgi:hypothetical protein